MSSMKLHILGIWSFISSVHVPESFEENMVVYFNKARLALGEQLFLENFFQQETVTEEEYLENLSDLHRKAFADNVRDAELFLGRKYNFVFIGLT